MDMEIALIGNPNCGKTSLFNQLTGSQQMVGNWPGVTVERKTGWLQLDGRRVLVSDLPGLYSLSEGGGEDEEVVRRYLVQTPPQLVVNLLDARQLERQLYLTLQLIEQGLPLLVLIGMSDLARAEGIAIDCEALAQRLGVPVLEVVCNRPSGVKNVCRFLQQLEPARIQPSMPLPYAELVEQALQLVQQPGQTRFSALCLLEGTLAAPPAVQPALEAARGQLVLSYGDDADIAIADARYSAISALMQACRQHLQAQRDARLDRWVLHRVLGLPLFLLVMYLMFSWSVNFGGALVDAFDGVAGALFVSGTTALLESINAPAWLIMVLANGLGEGVRTVAGFIPTLACLYLALGALEDCGYLARAAFVIDRLMRTLGLPGRAFVPMMVGFGCNVPAIMATRTLDGRATRILASMMIPFVSCGARLPVYVLFASAFFPGSGGQVVMSLYLAGLLIAMATGLLLRPLVLRADATPVIMELPRWHTPNIGNVLRQAWTRLAGFMLGAGKLIVPMVLVVNLLSSVDGQGRLRPDAPDESLLALTARVLTPVLQPVGVQADNWPATVGLITGVLAKEAVAGTLFASYSRLAGVQEAAEDSGGVLDEAGAALATVPDNLQQVAANLADPLGLNAAEAEAQEQAAGAAPALQEMRERFVSAEAAYAFLLFVLLYTPCAAALSALRTEVGTRWMLISAIWTLAVAYMVAASYRLLVPLIGVVPLLPVALLLLLLSVLGLAPAGQWWRRPRPTVQEG